MTLYLHSTIHHILLRREHLEKIASARESVRRQVDKQEMKVFYASNFHLHKCRSEYICPLKDWLLRAPQKQAKIYLLFWSKHNWQNINLNFILFYLIWSIKFSVYMQNIPHSSTICPKWTEVVLCHRSAGRMGYGIMHFLHYLQMQLL